KATEDIEGFDAGILHIRADGPRKGDVVAVGALIGFVLQQDEPIPAVNQPSILSQHIEPIAARSSAPGTAAPPPMRDRLASSPRARRAAANLGIDWQNATGTGRTGRIRERDVVALAASIADAPPASPANSIRRVIAERMLTSHRSTAPVTLMTTIDAT